MDRYISNQDLARFSIGQRLTGVLPLDPGYHNINQLPSLEEMFSDPEVYYTFIFLENPGKKVGHWVLLIKWDEETFEYFDCLAQPPPPQLEALFKERDCLVFTCNEPLMAKDGVICGKWCMFRVSTLPHKLETFYAFFEHWKMKPDDLVDFVVNIPVEILR